MTADEIERKAQRFIEHLDRLLLAGEITQDDHNKAKHDVHFWAVLKHLNVVAELLNQRRV